MDKVTVGASEGAQRLLLGAVSRLVSAMPRRLILLAGAAFGLLLYAVLPRRRRIAMDNLRQAFGGDRSGSELRSLCRRSFAHLGMNLMEFLALPSLDAGKTMGLVRIEGAGHLDEALLRGKGVLVLSAHLGNWDLLGAALARRGYPMSLISKVSRSGAVNRIWMGYRQEAGIRIFHGSGTMRDILHQLRDKGVVGFVLDQNALREDGVFVPFFGRQACTLSSLAVVARRTGAPVVPVHAWREGAGHRAVIEPPLSVEFLEDRSEDILVRTAQYTRWTEEVIRRHPDQWTWLHDRWRTRPAGEDQEPGIRDPGDRSQETGGKNGAQGPGRSKGLDS